MSITDELREYAHDCCARIDDDIHAIADRIDAEHERLMKEQPYTIDMVPMTDEHMAEHGWVRLPVDADGEIIHVEDVMAYADNTKPMEVVALVPPAVFLTEDGPRYADMCRHYHKPTVEDVLAKFALACEDADNAGLEVAHIIAEYAAKLQLREDA